jgi:cbb3-type cytochrome oxidase subunit 3
VIEHWGGIVFSWLIIAYTFFIVGRVSQMFWPSKRNQANAGEAAKGEK